MTRTTLAAPVRVLAALLVLAAAAAGREPAPPDPEPLPGGLRPGAKATFSRAADGDFLAGKVRFEVLAGEDEGTVRLVREFATGDAGPLSFRDRLTAVLDTATRRVRSFRYEGAGGDAELRLLTRFGPDPDREGRYLHERFTYRDRGDPRRKKTRLRLEGTWIPDLLEPFLAGLFAGGDGETAEVRLLTVTRGRLVSTPVVYRSVGEGLMELAEDEKVRCRIVERVRGDARSLAYLRSKDRMPVSFGLLELDGREPR